MQFAVFQAALNSLDVWVWNSYKISGELVVFDARGTIRAVNADAAIVEIAAVVGCSEKNVLQFS
jgi:hypothetical protein